MPEATGGDKGLQTRLGFPLQKVNHSDHGLLGGPEKQTTGGVADQVQVREGCADDGAGQGIVLKAQEGDQVAILGGFHQEREDQYIDGQQLHALGEEDPAEAADQGRDQHIADVGTDEIVVDIQGNIQFNEEDDHKKGCVSNASFFHKISPP